MSGTNNESDNSSINAFNKSGIKRTPPPALRSGNDIFFSPVNVATPHQNRLKRVADEDINRMSQDLLYDKLVSRFNTLSNQIKEMESNVERKLDEKFNNLQDYMDKTDQKIDDLKVQLESTDSRSTENSKAINLLNQKELMNKIDIVGAKWPSTIKKESFKDEVIKLLFKCSISVNANDIKSAFLRKSKSSDRQVMVVEFVDFETKLKVMKKKRQLRSRDGIFFDHTLTPTNVKFMIDARKIAKEKNFKVYLNGHKVCIRQSDVNARYITSEEDLEAVKMWIPNVASNTGLSRNKSVAISSSPDEINAATIDGNSQQVNMDTEPVASTSAQ